MLFDTHCHLDVGAFDQDRDAVIARARQVGVTRFLNPAYDLDSSRRAVALAQGHADVVAAVGVHPNDALTFDDAQLETLYALAQSPKVVAIGEIGLDYHWQTVPRVQQAAAFIAQLHLARRLMRPVIIHCREAYDDVLDILVKHGDGVSGVVLHAFSGKLAHMRVAVQRGYALGIGGPVTYPNAHRLREVVRAMPLDRLLVETDSPYLAPQMQRGQRNEPAYLTAVVEKIAEIHGMNVGDIAQIATDNGRRIFRLD